MQGSFSDIDFLREIYNSARNKYKPSQVSTLLIAEGPPDNLDRYFYFEDVKRQDSLFLEIMGVLYPERKERYLAAGRDTVLKHDLLQSFKEDGFWLMDLSEVPCSLANSNLESCVPSLLYRLNKNICKTTPIILIKSNVYDICYSILHSNGFNVNAERMPFPGSGQQKVFREKFKKAVGFH
jgi:hypothetical protein